MLTKSKKKHRMDSLLGSSGTARSCTYDYGDNSQLKTEDTEPGQHINKRVKTLSKGSDGDSTTVKM